MANMAGDNLKGKTYLITGASSGIGAATALALGERGANVVLAARRDAACHEVARGVASKGGTPFVVRADVTIETDIREAVRQTVERFGRLDGAFNNAGRMSAAAMTQEVQNEDFDVVMRTNVSSVLWSMQYEIAAMLQTGGGAIVNNASIAAHIGVPMLSVYSASKSAVLGLTRSAALEYFKLGVRVNAICPGPTHTPMTMSGFGSEDKLQSFMAPTPAGRAAHAEEIAGPVLFLLSGAASYITGQSLSVDGGYTAQ